MGRGAWLAALVVACLAAVGGAVRPKGMRHFDKVFNLRSRARAGRTPAVGERWRADDGSMSLIETIMRAGVTMVDAAYLPAAYNAQEVMANASNYVEHVVKEGEDIDSLAHNYYFGDHWKAMDLLMFNIAIQRAKAGAHDFAVGDRVIIPKPIRMCEAGWTAFGGPPKLEQQCEKKVEAEECVKHHGRQGEDGNCICDVRCLGNMKCSDYKDWVPPEAVGNHPRRGWGPIVNDIAAPTGMTGSTGGTGGTGGTGASGAEDATGPWSGGKSTKDSPFWSGALKLLGKKKNATAAVGGASAGAAPKTDAEYCAATHKSQDQCNADTRCTWQNGPKPERCIAAPKAAVAGPQ